MTNQFDPTKPWEVYGPEMQFPEAFDLMRLGEVMRNNRSNEPLRYTDRFEELCAGRWICSSVMGDSNATWRRVRNTRKPCTLQEAFAALGSGESVWDRDGDQFSLVRSSVVMNGNSCNSMPCDSQPLYLTPPEDK